MASNVQNPPYTAGGVNPAQQTEQQYFPPPPPGPPPGDSGNAQYAPQTGAHDGPGQIGHGLAQASGKNHHQAAQAENLYDPSPEHNVTGQTGNYGQSGIQGTAQPGVHGTAQPGVHSTIQQHGVSHSHGAHGPTKPHDATQHPNAAYTGNPPAGGHQSAFSKLSQKLHGIGNKFSTKLGTENFIPSSMDKECEKAARIFRSFCKDGIYANNDDPRAQQPLIAPPVGGGAPAAAGHTTAAAADRRTTGRSSRALLTIPPKVIQKAVGLAIFTTARAGFYVSASTGSGIVIARLPDGSWSPPSAIQVNSLGAGLVIGVDIYDCVCVINTVEALRAFTTSSRVSLGPDVAVSAGPYGAGGSLDVDLGAVELGGRRPGSRGRGDKHDAVTAQQSQQGVHPTSRPAATDGAQTIPGAASAGTTAGTGTGEHKPSRLDSLRRPVYSYVKSRGLFAGATVDGTVFNECEDANAAFYGKRVRATDILHGNVPQTGPVGMWPGAARVLMDTLRGAEGPLQEEMQAQLNQGQQHPVGGGVAQSTTADHRPVGASGGGFDAGTAGPGLGAAGGAPYTGGATQQHHGLSGPDAGAGAAAAGAQQHFSGPQHQGVTGAAGPRTGAPPNFPPPPASTYDNQNAPGRHDAAVGRHGDGVGAATQALDQTHLGGQAGTYQQQGPGQTYSGSGPGGSHLLPGSGQVNPGQHTTASAEEAKAAEARSEQDKNNPVAHESSGVPPEYMSHLTSDDVPPPYEDDGQARRGVGDVKRPQ